MFLDFPLCPAKLYIFTIWIFRGKFGDARSKGLEGSDWEGMREGISVPLGHFTKGTPECSEIRRNKTSCLLAQVTRKWTFKKIITYVAVSSLSCSSRDLHYGVRTLSCGPQNLSSLTRDQSWAPALGAQSLSHWTSREVRGNGYFIEEVSEQLTLG